MYEDIFEYQNYDIEIFKIKVKTKKSEYNKIITSMIQKNKEMQKNKEVMEKEAEKQVNYIKQVEKEIADENKKVKDLEKAFNNKEISFEELKVKSSEESIVLNNLIKKLSKMQKDFEIMQKKYEELKKNATIIKTNYKNAKDAQDRLFVNENKKIEELENAKKKLQSKIDASIINEYEKMKKDNIMPVYVRIVDNNCCGGCRQKLSTADLAKNQNKIECEMCRRIIIKG